MTDLRTAAQQALESLMWHDETVRTRGDDEAIEALRAALASPAAPVSPPAPGGEAVVYAVVDKDGQFVTVPVNDIVRAKAWAERLEWMQHMEDDKPLPVRFRIVVLVPLIERTAP